MLLDGLTFLLFFSASFVAPTTSQCKADFVANDRYKVAWHRHLKGEIANRRADKYRADNCIVTIASTDVVVNALVQRVVDNQISHLSIFSVQHFRRTDFFHLQNL